MAGRSVWMRPTSHPVSARDSRRVIEMTNEHRRRRLQQMFIIRRRQRRRHDEDDQNDG